MGGVVGGVVGEGVGEVVSGPLGGPMGGPVGGPVPVTGEGEGVLYISVCVFGRGGDRNVNPQHPGGGSPTFMV